MELVESEAVASPLQEQTWFSQQVAPDIPAYTMSVGFRLTGQLDVDALRAAARDIADLHPALRTRLRMRDGQLFQQVATSLDPPLFVSSGDPDSMARRAVRTFFDITDLPLWRIELIRVSAAEHRLWLVIHHAICDGLSLTTLLTDLSLAYNSRARGVPPTLSRPRKTFLDFTREREATLARGAFADRLAYWRSHLGDAPPVSSFPGDRPRPPRQSFQGASHTVDMPGPVFDGLVRRARENRTTPFMVLLTGLFTLLRRRTGASDLVVGIATAGRPSRMYQDVVGPFVETVPVRAELAGGDPLDRVQRAAANAMANSVGSFSDIVRMANPKRGLAHHPLFQVLLETHGEPGGALGFEGLDAVPLRPPDPASSLFDVTFAILTSATGALLTCEYDNTLFRQSTITDLASEYVDLILPAGNKPETGS